MLDKIARYYNTLKYLKPTQLTGQLKKGFSLRTVPRIPTFSGCPIDRPMTLIPDLDLDSVYLARFDVDSLMNNTVTLLYETHFLDVSTWTVEASALWRFNLHYFEYAISLGVSFNKTGAICYYSKFKELVLSWIKANPIGKGDSWHPYTISIRLPNWFICFDLFGQAFETDVAFKETVYESIYAQYQVLLKRKETWQLGNHYFENLKTILLCSLLFDEQRVYDKHIQLFLREVDEEVLSDGVHFELSIMYHKVILEGVIRVTYWLKQTKKPQYIDLLPVIQRMTDAVASLESGMGKTPLFNDSGDGVAKESSSLLKAANELFNITPHFADSFPASGYYKLYDGDIALMFDAGEIGPRYMTGHGHCDCLSFELSVNGNPLFVNSGTYQYQGELRKYFRSTSAHNTLIIGDREQSECWGEHRVARRINNVKVEKNGQLIKGSYRSYLGDTHVRIISLVDRTLTVLDSVSVAEPAIVHSYLHLADSYNIVAIDGSLIVLDGKRKICAIKPVEAGYFVHTSGNLAYYAQMFGRLTQTSCIEFIWYTDDRQHGYVIQIY